MSKQKRAPGLLPGRPRQITPEQERRCVEVLRDQRLSVRQCLDVLQQELPALTRTTLLRINKRDQRDNPALARPRRADALIAKTHKEYGEAGETSAVSKRGRPLAFTPEEIADIRALVDAAGSISAARQRVVDRYPLLQYRSSRDESIRALVRTVRQQHDAIRYIYRPSPSPDKAPEIRERAPSNSPFMQSCHDNNFNRCALLVLLGSLCADEGIDRRSASELQLLLRRYTWKEVNRRTLDTMLRKLAIRGVLQVEPGPRGRLYTFGDGKPFAALVAPTASRKTVKQEENDICSRIRE